MTVSVGLIKGRHPMPVDAYLIEEPVVEFGQAHRVARDAAVRLCKTQGLQGTVAFERVADSVDLYVTGLTRATLGALAGFHGCGVRVNIYEYNAETQDYESVIAVGVEEFVDCVSTETRFTLA